MKIDRGMTELEEWQYRRERRNQAIALVIALFGVGLATFMIWRCWNGM